MLFFTMLSLLFVLPENGCGFLFELKSSEKELNFLYEEPLEIECSFNPDNSGIDVELISVEGIHIIRKQDSNKWSQVAKLQANGYVRKVSSDVQVSGSVGPEVNDTFLKLHWNVASNEELGIYRCDVVAVDENYEFDIQESNMLTIFEHNVTTEDLLGLSQRHINSLQLEFDKFKKKTARKLARLERIVKRMKNVNESQDDTFDDNTAVVDVTDLKEDIRESVIPNVTELMDQMTCTRVSNCWKTYPPVLSQTDKTTVPPQSTTSADNPTTPRRKENTSAFTVEPTTTVAIEPTTEPDTTIEYKATTVKATEMTTTQQPTTAYQRPEMPWPAGKFALLKPDSGCPKTSVSPNWSEGYIKYHTESQDVNHNNVTYNTHLAEPIIEADRFNNHFLYMHFCVNSDVNPTSQQWPSGSYCILRKDWICPDGFQPGYINIDEEDTNYDGKNRGALPDMLYFCCRDDGSPDQAITLPSSSPFYLYRFGGQCQEVKDMQVTPEMILLDTENTSNQDDYENQYHPDGKLDDLEFQLCYYA